MTDLTLTNNKSYVKHSKTLVTGISDFQKLIATATKTNFAKSNLTIKYYRDYKNFDADMVVKDLKHG